MHYRSLASIFVITLALTAGCGGGGDDETFADKFNAVDVEYRTAIEFQCDCYANYPTPYASKDACIADWYAPPDPTELQCIVDASKLNSESSNARIECELAAMQNYANCMDVVLDCNNLMNTYFQCSDQLNAEVTQCAPLDPAVAQASAACSPQQ